MILALLRLALAIVVLTAVVVVCAAAIVVGVVHPRLTPRRALDALGEFNREAAALMRGE